MTAGVSGSESVPGRRFGGRRTSVSVVIDHLVDEIGFVVAMVL